MKPPLQENPFSAGNAKRKRDSAQPQESWLVLPFDPDFAVFEEFFFPDGGHLFEFVDGVMAGVECGSTMGRCNNDGDAGFADVEMAQAMDHGDAIDIPGLANENADLFQF